MPAAITVLHAQGRDPLAAEGGPDAIFAGEERPRVLRLEGTYSAVLARLTDPDLAAAYRYLILRPHGASAWTPVLELGNRTEGLDVELSRRLDGAAVFTAFVYGDVVSGYRLARGGALVDQYLSDPTAIAEEGESAPETASADADHEAVRGHPERFAGLLPSGTAPDDFARVVLRPGWWEEHDAGSAAAPASTAAAASSGNEAGDGGDVSNAGDESADGDDGDEGGDLVDEVDRMRCIGLALELWASDDYPLARDAEDIPNAVAGPAVVLAYT